MLLQEEKKKLRKGIEENDTDLIQQMFQGNNIDVNADIMDVRVLLLISTVYTYTVTYVSMHYGD